MNSGRAVEREKMKMLVKEVFEGQGWEESWVSGGIVNLSFS